MFPILRAILFSESDLMILVKKIVGKKFEFTERKKKRKKYVSILAKVSLLPSFGHGIHFSVLSERRKKEEEGS